jgi:hypothetical protein
MAPRVHPVQEVAMSEFCFWIVAVFSVSPSEIRETSGIGPAFTLRGAGHE